MSDGNWTGKTIPPFTNADLFSKKKHNEVLTMVNALANPEIVRGGKDGVKISDRNVKYMLKREQSQFLDGMHPFKIYNYPAELRRFVNDDDFRRFKVRSGEVWFGPTWDAGTNAALGTDQSTYLHGNPFGNEPNRSQTPPTDATQISALWNEISIPADGNLYYFWYSTCLSGLLSSGNTHGVLVGASASTATSLETGQTGLTDPYFDSFPVDDPYRKIIGSVLVPTSDLASYYYVGTPYVQQIANTSMHFPAVQTSKGVGRTALRGLYSATVKYYCGDIVYKDVTSGGRTKRTLYQYFADTTIPSVYPPRLGPILAVDPAVSTPDPWLAISTSFLQVDYVTGAYDASKYYLRTA